MSAAARAGPAFGRALVLTGAAQLAVSFTLLIWASTARPPVVRWTWPGVVDVLLAATLFLTAGYLWTKTRDREQTARARVYGAAATISPLVLAALWQFHDRIDWNILLPGLAWRLFLLVHTLPSAVVAWQSGARRGGE